MTKEYKWYAVVSPKGAKSINAFTIEEKEFLINMGYKFKEISIYIKTK